ncbi:conserved membrane hypothetical protein [Gammaproteobacteria bacterium]
MSDKPTNGLMAPPNPLGLPPGSVRAIVALTVVGVFVWFTWHGKPMGIMLSEAMLIVLAHYFASRQLLTMSAPLRQQLEAQGLLTHDANPLWLPRHSIRILILTAIFLTGALLLLRGELFEAGRFDNLLPIFAYFIGIVIHQVQALRPPRPLSRWQRLWIHLKAIFVVLACLLILLAALSESPAGLPDGLSHLLLGWILFYFGSR